MRITIFLLALVLGLLTWSRPPFDPDLGWHLVGGEIVSEHLAQGARSPAAIIPQFDPINTFATNWHDYHWLGQLLMAKAFHFGGFDLLQLFLGILSALTLFLVADTMLKRFGPQAHPLALLLGISSSAFALYDTASVRPQMLALFILALTMRRLVSETRLWELPFLFSLAVICANLHVYWILIPLLWFAFRALPRFASHQVSAWYAWSGFFLLSTAGLISPYGLFGNDWTLAGILKNYAVLWDYLHTDPYLLTTISEFRSPFAVTSLVSIFLLLALMFLVRTIRPNYLRHDPGGVLLSIVTLLLAIYQRKFLGLFAVIGVPCMASAPMLRSFRSSLSAFFYFPITLFIALVIGAVAFISGPWEKPVFPQIIAEEPIEACMKIPALGITPSHGRDHVRVATHFNYGGWCRWAMYQADPHFDGRVTTDGRTQGLDAGRIKASSELFALKEGWEQTLTATAPDLIVAAREHQLAHMLFLMPKDWTPIYQDLKFAVFSANHS